MVGTRARTFVLCALATAFLLPWPGVARADDLQSLTITYFVITADRTHIGPTDIVHLNVDVHVREHIDQLSNIVLPDVYGFEKVGVDGTDYHEVLTLSPQRMGTYQLGPAKIVAINSADSKPSKFESNTVSITVAPPVAHDTPEQAKARTLFFALIAIIIAFLAFLFGTSAINFCVEQFVGRKEPVLVDVEPEPEPEPVIPPTRLEILKGLIEQTRMNPDRKHALALRLALREAMDIGPDETLSDATPRLPEGERGLLAKALRAAERAAFIDDDGRTTAIEDGLVLIEAARTRLEKQL
jgi:hypothetical protein